MKRCFAMVMAFCVTLLAMPLISAQDAEKKEAKDVEKKDVAKKDDAKKDDAKKDGEDEPKKKEDGKDEPKKGDPKSSSKSKHPEEPKLVHGPVLQGVKLKAVDSDESRSFTVEMMAPDPVKMMQNQQWQMQRMFQLQQNRLSNPAQYMNDMRTFQMEMMRRQSQAYSMKDVLLKAENGCKVRILQPAAEYDEKGNLKKWTKKDLDALKGNSKLPGYPADFDALRQGQYLVVYLAAPKGSEKKLPGGPPPKKKNDDEDVAMPQDRQDTVMIVIVGDPGNK